jgi:hypothetical protein
LVTVPLCVHILAVAKERQEISCARDAYAIKELKPSG